MKKNGTPANEGEGDTAEHVLNGAARCTVIKKNGERCKSPALRNLQMCRMHGGAFPRAIAKSRRIDEERVLKESVAALDLNVRPNIRPEVALLQEIQTCAQIVQWHKDLIAELEPSELEPGLKVVRITDNQGVEMAVSQHVLLKALSDWQDRLARMSKMALDAGVAERQVRIMESQASQITDAMRLIFDDLGIDHSDPKVAKVIAKRLLALDREPDVIDVIDLTGQDD